MDPWLHAAVIPGASPGGKTRHISGAVDAHLGREWTWISDDRGPRSWKHGSLDPDHGNRPEKHDHALRPTPG